MKKLLPVFAFVLVAAAIVLSFFAALKADFEGQIGTYKSIIWGCKEVDVNGHIYTIKATTSGMVESSGIAILPFVGLILMFVGGLGVLLVALFAKKPSAKWVILICGLIIIAGAVMQFFAMRAFARALTTSIGKALGMSKEEIESQVQSAIENLHKQNPKAVVSIIMGSLGCLAGVSAIGSALLADKK